MKLRIFAWTVCLAVMTVPLLVSTSCSRSGGVVEWPALKEMDEWAEKGEGWAEDNKIAEMRQGLPGLKGAAEKLVASPVPYNAKDPASVAQAMGDFRELLKELNKPTLSDAELKTAVGSIHPLIEKLMGVSGMPYLHEHPGETTEKK